jgi:hypothetical protein
MATVYIKHNATPLSESANHDLKKCHPTGLLNPLTEMDILDLIDQLYPCIQRHAIHQVLQFLLESPEFDYQICSGKGSIIGMVG